VVAVILEGKMGHYEFIRFSAGVVACSATMIVIPKDPTGVPVVGFGCLWEAVQARRTLGRMGMSALGGCYTLCETLFKEGIIVFTTRSQNSNAQNISY
jgi:hypothetical protein